MVARLAQAHNGSLNGLFKRELDGDCTIWIIGIPLENKMFGALRL